MNIKRKLVVLFTVLSIFIIAIILNNIHNISQKQIQIGQVKNLNDLSSVLSLLIHETQKERGASAGYIGSKGAKFRDILSSQKISTNQKIDKLKNYLDEHKESLDSKELKDELDLLYNFLYSLDSIRSKVTNLSISAKDEVKFYTDMNKHILNITAINARLSTNQMLVKSLSAYTNFLKSKERAGIERAVLSATFAFNSFKDGMFPKWIKLVAEQDSYADSFLSIADKKIAQEYKQTMSKDAVVEVQKMRDIALQKASTGGFNVDATYWFKTITNKINLLKKVDDKISESNNLKIEKLISKNKLLLIINVIVGLCAMAIIIFSFIINKNILRDLTLLEKGLNSFFRYLNKVDLEIELIKKNSDDEIGQMIKTINQNIQKTKENFDNDNKTFDEIVNKLALLSDGDFNGAKIDADYQGNYARAKDAINRTISTTQERLLKR